MEQLKNSYENEDAQQVITEFEKLDAEVESIMAAARGKANGVRTKQKNLLKEARDDLRIPIKSLRKVIATRKLERKIKGLADEVPEEEVEVYVDMMGQFSFLKPADGGKSAAQVAADMRSEEAAAQQDLEQEEGKAVLDGMMGSGKPN